MISQDFGLLKVSIFVRLYFERDSDKILKFTTVNFSYSKV